LYRIYVHTSRFDLKKLKEGENVKTKFYRALCVCRGSSDDLPQLEHLNKLKNVRIIQKTPVRVLHRRGRSHTNWKNCCTPLPKVLTRFSFSMSRHKQVHTWKNSCTEISVGLSRVCAISLMSKWTLSHWTSRVLI